MAVPPSSQFNRAVLEIAAEAEGAFSIKDVRDSLSGKLDLTEEDLNEMIPTGVLTKVYSRTSWAISSLKNAGLLESPERGKRQITEQGRKYLMDHPREITTSELMKLRDELERKPEPVNGNTIGGEPTEEIDPYEQISKSYLELQGQLERELLEKIKDVSPKSFEILVNRLLSRIGYGEIEQEAGKPGDQGIDGILNQDPLGLEKVYVQAKRYTTGQVREPDIRNFSGSLDRYGATRGVFITNAEFASQAYKTAREISKGPKSIQLIDGKKLAALMIKHNVGVVIGETYEVKRLDDYYFEEIA